MRFLLSLLPVLIWHLLDCANAVTLSAGSHLDMGVIVTVQNNNTGEDSCRRARISWEGSGENGGQ